MNKGLILLASFVAVTSINAQITDLKGWHLADRSTDKVNGIGIKKAYDFLKDKKGNTVIVAVIDGGIDTTQEDLQQILWRNPKEIPGNGIDDDHNGYVDDVFGWNFLGGKDGRCIEKTSSEKSRVYHQYKQRFLQTDFDSLALDETGKQQYAIWKKAAAQMNVDPYEQVNIMFLEVAFKAFKKHDKAVRLEWNKEEFTVEELENFIPQSQGGKQSKLSFLTFIKLLGLETTDKNTDIIRDLEEYIKGKKESFEAKDTPPIDYRSEIVKDNYFDFNDRYYGNGNVMGGDPMHGTHVSGIIGAQRNNGIGMDGVADLVKIMTIRAVPNGDEYDKDIALAIRYAVDNGAKVINMSFGKSFSPEKNWVDEAIKYAESKDVLLVHAAGNDSKNVDSTDNFPSPYCSINDRASNYITVGASGDAVLTGNAVATFSNYGKNRVDVLAPGVKIYSTLPGGNHYGFKEGTSMAAPVVSGVAALIRSYYPNLTAQQVKWCIESGVDRTDSAALVNKPGTQDMMVPLSSLCNTAGYVNAASAITLAEQISNNAEKNLGQLPDKLPKQSFKNLKPKQ
jgi:subtilisin family serine protease